MAPKKTPVVTKGVVVATHRFNSAAVKNHTLENNATVLDLKQSMANPQTQHKLDANLTPADFTVLSRTNYPNEVMPDDRVFTAGTYEVAYTVPKATKSKAASSSAAGSSADDILLSLVPSKEADSVITSMMLTTADTIVVKFCDADSAMGGYSSLLEAYGLEAEAEKTTDDELVKEQLELERMQKALEDKVKKRNAAQEKLKKIQEASAAEAASAEVAAEDEDEEELVQPKTKEK